MLDRGHYFSCQFPCHFPSAQISPPQGGAPGPLLNLACVPQHSGGCRSLSHSHFPGRLYTMRYLPYLCTVYYPSSPVDVHRGDPEETDVTLSGRRDQGLAPRTRDPGRTTLRRGRKAQGVRSCRRAARSPRVRNGGVRNSSPSSTRAAATRTRTSHPHLPQQLHPAPSSLAST